MIILPSVFRGLILVSKTTSLKKKKRQNNFIYEESIFSISKHVGFHPGWDNTAEMWKSKGDEISHV